MGNPNLIEVTGVANEVIDCDKFNKSISIYKCKGEKGKAGKIEVNGKCNSLMLDNCERIDLHVDSVMSTVEISNCQRVKLFMKPGANVLSVVIDKTDGCLITLSKESQVSRIREQRPVRGLRQKETDMGYCYLNYAIS